MLKFKIFILYLATFIFFENQVFANQIFTFNNQVGPIKPSKYSVAEKNDPFERIASSYIIPERWTNVISPLNDLKVVQGWSLVDSKIYQEIASLNPEIRMLGPANHPSKEYCWKLLTKNPEKYMSTKNIIGAEEYEARFDGCLFDLRARAYEGDLDWLLRVTNAWSKIGFTQPRKEEEDYNWFRVINFASTLFALYKDQIKFSEEFEKWLSDSLINTELKNFDTENNTFLVRGIVKDDQIWANDCSTTRFMYTQAYLLGGLALENQEIFDEGIDSLQYILSSFDKDNIYPCWAMRGIRAPTYYNQIPVWLSAFHATLETVDYDLLEHEMPNGSKVFEAAKTTFDLIWSDDLGPILDYASINLGVPENKNWQNLNLPLIERNPDYLPTKPQTIVRNSMYFVERYSPILKEKYGYKKYHNNKAFGKIILEVYSDPDWYSLFMGDQALDIDALFRVKSHGIELSSLNALEGLLIPDFNPDLGEYKLDLVDKLSSVNLTFEQMYEDEIFLDGVIQNEHNNSFEIDLSNQPEKFIITVQRNEKNFKNYKVNINFLKTIEDRYDCKFNINRIDSGASYTLLAKGVVRIVKGKTIFRNVDWQSGANKEKIPKAFLDENSKIYVLRGGDFIGSSTIYTDIGNDTKETFYFGNKFDKEGEHKPMGFHNGKSDTEKTFIEIDVYKCKIIPDIVTTKISNKNNDNKKTKPTLSLKKIELPIDLNKLSIEFYGLTERDDFIKFKGSITDVSGEQFGKGKLNFALMFDFKSVTSKKNKKVKDYKITLQANDLKGVSDINIIRACGKKAFWEDDGEIKQINIYIRTFKDNKCSFEKLPLETVKVIERLVSNMILIINDAKFKDPDWNKRIIELTKKFH